MKEAYIRTNDKAEHDGKVSVLDTSYDADSKTLTFQTNLFSSDYAITYKDTKVKDNEDPKKDDPGQEDPKKDDNNGGNTGNNGNNGTSGNGTSGSGTSQSSTSTTSPKTGDTTNVAGYGMTLLLSLAAAFGAIFKRKKKTEDPEE